MRRFSHHSRARRAGRHAFVWAEWPGETRHRSGPTARSLGVFLPYPSDKGSVGLAVNTTPTRQRQAAAERSYRCSPRWASAWSSDSRRCLPCSCLLAACPRGDGPPRRLRRGRAGRSRCLGGRRPRPGSRDRGYAVHRGQQSAAGLASRPLEAATQVGEEPLGHAVLDAPQGHAQVRRRRMSQAVEAPPAPGHVVEDVVDAPRRWQTR